MGNPRCQWVCDRLPLLAGDDLPGLDRRRVERHLIGCPKCRHRRAALDQTLGILQTVAAESPLRPDAPSLWPALARQIRESRRPARVPFFGSWRLWPRRLELWPAVGLGLGLAVAALVALGAHRQIDDAQASIEHNARPIAPAISLTEAAPPAVETPAPSPEAEAPGAVESVPASQVGYDLDHAMPMGPEARERKQPTY
jgi:anti-sigma factor RsiW